MESSHIKNGDDFIREVTKLVVEYRSQCFWFMNLQYRPEDLESALRALSYLEKYGDQKAFKKVSELRKWLLQNSSVISASL